MLFDMQKDVVESTNVYGQHPEIAEAMMVELGGIIENGRSTPGPKQENAAPSKGQWHQLDTPRDYMK